MAHSLDDPKTLSEIDPRGMLKIIDAFPENCRQAIHSTEKMDINAIEGRRFSNLVIAGMGGSAVGGLLLRDWLQPTTHIPIIVTRDYSLPAFVSKESMVFCVSYSGNTEETLSSLNDALKRKASVICFSSGGKIEETSSQRGLPLIKLPSGFQPRAAIPQQFFSLAVVAKRLNLIGHEWEEVEEAITILSELRNELSPSNPNVKNEAKKLATALMGYHPLIIGTRLLEGVAYRWATQLNENSKSPACSAFIPEAFHNLIMASEASPDLLGKICIILLNDPEEKVQLPHKIERFEKIVNKRFGKIVKVNARGKGRLARILSTLLIGDYTSAYLAILYGKDPSSVSSIEELKRV